MSGQYLKHLAEVKPRERTNAHPFDLCSESDLAIAHLRGVEALEAAFGRQLGFVYAALDRAHLERLPGDYCPFDCHQCDALRAG